MRGVAYLIRSLQARHAYLPADIRMNERFAAVGLRTNDRGKDGLDLTAFDDTCRADVSMGRCVLLPVVEGGVDACVRSETHNVWQNVRARGVWGACKAHQCCPGHALQTCLCAVPLHALPE